MVHWQLPSRTPQQVSVASATTPTQVTVTGSATPHTKGAWTEITSATPEDVRGFWLSVEGTNVANTDTSVLLDLGIGAAGSEIVVLANVQCGFIGTAPQARWIPLDLPAGVRVAARIQGIIASETALVGLRFHARDHGWFSSRECATCATYGADTATSKGVALTTVGAVGTPGAWTQIAATIGAQIDALLCTVQGNGSATQACTGIIDVGFGASGQEVAVVSVAFEMTTSEEVRPFQRMQSEAMIGVCIPAGSRLVGRYACSNTSTQCRPSVAVHGFTR